MEWFLAFLGEQNMKSSDIKNHLILENCIGNSSSQSLPIPDSITQKTYYSLFFNSNGETPNCFLNAR